MNPINPRLPLLFLAAILLALPSPAWSAAPGEELLRFVPPDVSFCVVVRDLRGHLAAMHASPLAERFRASPLGKVLQAAPEWQHLEKADQFLEKFLGLSAEQLRDDILGDALVLAYQSGPPERPEQEQGLFLIRARDAKKLAALVERINQVHKSSGELKSIEAREHDGLKYFRRLENKEVNFYYLRGPVLVFSGQETMIRRAITQDRKLPASKESPVAERLRQLGADQALTAVWLNPRAFDAVLSARLGEAKGSEAAFLKTFVDLWKSLEGVAFTFTVSANVEMGLTVRARPEGIPAPVRRFLDEAATHSDLWARFPDSALLAVGSRLHASALLDLLGAFHSREAFVSLKEELNRRLGTALDKDVVAGVLPHLGPDWGLCVTAPERADREWFPSVVFALRVGIGDKEAPLDRALVNTLHSYALLTVLAHNSKKKEPLRLKTLRQGKAVIHYLASAKGSAVGLQPAFGLHGGYLVLATSPEAIQRFAALTPPSKTGGPAGEIPLFRLSLKEVSAYLTQRREAVATALAEQNKVPVEQVGRNLDNLAAGLKFFDRLELTQKTAPGRVTFCLRLKPALPLRK